ncbi:hypothetical protein GCM10023080_074760 [Streptomyces pseudoechinosporeus]
MAVGVWPTSGTTTNAVGDTFRYNLDSITGDSFTWPVRVPETGTYRVDAHYVQGANRATNAPYTVTAAGGATSTYTVNQTSGSGGVWTSLGGGGNELSFNKGGAYKVELKDTSVATSQALVADAVRLVDPAKITKLAGQYNRWHSFPVSDTVQQWVDGTAVNHGFVLKSTDEASNPIGGPRYEAGDGEYGGETSTIPRLTVTYGKVGTALDSPTVVHSTGPELTWKAYSNTTGDADLNIAEYQLHRSTRQAFTPSAATLVAPIDKSATTYTDTTATPSPLLRRWRSGGRTTTRSR